MPKSRIRRLYQRLSTSGKGSIHSDRVFYAIYNNGKIDDGKDKILIYLASISIQSEHHEDVSDKKEFDRAKIEVSLYSNKIGKLPE